MRHSIHWGYAALAVLLVVTAGVVLIALGWRWLWLVPAIGVGLMLLNLLAVVLEDRWRMVTDRDVARGVPGNCRECDHALDILAKKTRFAVRCPICGSRESGRFLR